LLSTKKKAQAQIQFLNFSHRTVPDVSTAIYGRMNFNCRIIHCCMKLHKWRDFTAWTV